MSGRDKPSGSRRPGRRARRSRHTLAIGTAVVIAAGMLSACSSGGDSGGRVQLSFYQVQDPSGAIQSAVDDCSTSQYKISYNKLPASADQQRQQLVRRLAAQDASIDIMGMDVTWEAEFAEAGWIKALTGANKAQAENGTLKAALATATYKNKLYAVPFTSNTQLLWYRSDLLKAIGKTQPPKTWDEMIEDSRLLAKAGKPHLIQIQGAQYEGTTVWFNTMLSSAGGSVLSKDGKKVSLGAPAITALKAMKKLADSPGADPSLSVAMEDANRLGMESGTSAFELNYPFVYPSMHDNNPKLFKVFKYTTYPQVVAGKPSRVTIGGIDLAVSAYSKHAAMATKAALCLRNRKHQLAAATKGGLPPTIESLYDDPAMAKAYPFHEQILTALKNASVRPQTPAYQNISVVISHSVSPPGAISPSSTASTIRAQVKDALASKGLIP